MRTLWRAMALVLLAAAIGVFVLPRRPLDLARQRWDEQGIDHYLLRTTENVRGLECVQTVEVRDEVIANIVLNSCQHPSLWTIDWLFRRAQNARGISDPCARSISGVGCVCRQQIELQVVYDEARGHPRELRITRSWRPAWADFSFWRFAAQSGALPACVSPVPDPGWTISVKEVRPLP